MLNGFEEGRILEEGAIANGFADTSVVLQHTLACPNILVSHFRVAHLTFRQPHSFTRGFDRSMRPLLCDLVDVRCMCEGNGIAFFARIDAPAVHDDQYERMRSFCWRCIHYNIAPTLLNLYYVLLLYHA